MKTRVTLVALLLAAATIAAFWPAVHNGFLLDYDDNLYVAANPMVQGGLTGQSVRWAFTSVGYASNWHPLTWLSLMLDANLFGPSPRGSHLMNILFHAATALLLLTLWRRMTGALWPGVFMAFVFALHPLRVESVAWIAERKDVLSGACFILTLLAYLAHVRRPGPGRYLAVVGCFMLALLAKPMAVTLPGVLLLLDFWPLGRYVAPGSAARVGLPAGRQTPGRNLVLEKTPLFLLAAGAAAIAVRAQRTEGYVITLQDIALPDRLANAFVAYVGYLGKIFWPRDLIFFYPHPAAALPAVKAAAAALFLAAVTIVVLRTARRRPFLLVGWFWFLGTLVPVIGIVQVGWQGMADRYTYLPGIGITIMMAGALSGLPHRRDETTRGPLGSSTRLLLGAGALILAVTLGLLTRTQVGYWRDSVTLFTRTLEVTPVNWVIRNDLGTTLLLQGRPLEALPHLEAALALKPDFADNRLNLGVALEKIGRRAAAEQHYRELLRRSPGMAKAWFNLAYLLDSENRLEEAAVAYRGGLRLQPNFTAGSYSYGLVLERQGKIGEARDQYRETVRYSPGYAPAWYNLGRVSMNLGAPGAALLAFQEVLRFDPGNTQAARIVRALQERVGSAARP